MNIATLQSANAAATSGELTPAERVRQTKLQDAAQQFEGMMMKELLKPMQSGKDGEEDSAGGFGTGDPDRDTSLDTMSSYGTEAIAAALAKHGGMGIARQVMRQIQHQIGQGDGKIGK